MSVSEADPIVASGNPAASSAGPQGEQPPEPKAESSVTPPEPKVEPQLPDPPAAPFVSKEPLPPAEGAEEVTELDALLPEPSETFALANGAVVRLIPLKMRELLKLLRIITRGGTALLPTLRFNNNTPEQFAVQFVTVVAFAIPEAEDFAVDFVQSITRPADLQTGDSDAVKKFNQQQLTELFIYLDNPELEDLFQIIEQLVYREKVNLQSLGKRLQAMFKIAERTGQLPKNQSQDS